MPTRIRRQLLFSRTLMALVFLAAGISKPFNYAATLEFMRSAGVWTSALLLPASIAIELLGGLALATGFRPRITQLVLALYLVPVTLVFHRFWSVAGDARQETLVEFLKNAAICGGLLSMYYQQKLLDSFMGGTLVQIRKESYQRRRAA
jgi:putative oxidoreductase